MTLVVEDPPEWLDRGTVAVEPTRSYALLSPDGGVERRVYLTGVGSDRAYGVEHGETGEQVRLSDVRDLVERGRLVPAEAIAEGGAPDPAD